jgi:hypothetical protein
MNVDAIADAHRKITRAKYSDVAFVCASRIRTPVAFLVFGS